MESMLQVNVRKNNNSIVYFDRHVKSAGDSVLLVSTKNLSIYSTK